MKSLYLIFVLAVLLDLILMPSLLQSGWGPRFTLAVLPFLFLFSSRSTLTVLAVLASIFLWLTGGLNLGVAVFAFGTMIFFERWLLLRIFHRDSWQALAAAAGAIVVFGIFAAGLTEFLIPQSGLFRLSFVLTIITSTLLAVGINFFLKRLVYRQIHETTT